MFGVGYARSFSTSVKPELLIGVALVHSVYRANGILVHDPLTLLVCLSTCEAIECTRLAAIPAPNLFWDSF